ncbi:MAG: adenosylmethionine--8-amino-7-oxononanoate transaminase [Microbacteriaceae bacterium]|nr:adenosylmethionine--8-amino-7-oxononanoate transaminase [Microbacteriaceae bacterium]
MTNAKRGTVWHPFTQHGLEPEMLPIAAAEGAWLTAKDSRRILDAISSWWVVTHGHRHPRIIAAIAEQASKLDQVIFAGFTHEPAEQLAEGLIALAPEGLAHVFYSDSGSTSVEVALKMALGYWKNHGEARTRILALDDAYHGDTIGTMSAGARGVFNAAYDPLLFEVGRIPFPDGGQEQRSFDALDAECRKGNVAALIVEPLVLGAGGMRTYSPETLKEMRRITARHDVLLVADEVMTGFGRTGTLFACEQASISPDLLCVAKGITGGSMPLAATLCTRAIYDAHYSRDRSRTFFHSSSSTANPIACAAAVANLAIWREEPVKARVHDLSVLQSKALETIRRDGRFENSRALGTITAFDMANAGSGYLADVALKLRQAALKRDVLIRPLGPTIYLMPPYCITADELQFAYNAVSDAVDEVAA